MVVCKLVGEDVMEDTVVGDMIVNDTIPNSASFHRDVIRPEIGPRRDSDKVNKLWRPVSIYDTWGQGQ